MYRNIPEYPCEDHDDECDIRSTHDEDMRDTSIGEWFLRLTREQLDIADGHTEDDPCDILWESFEYDSLCPFLYCPESAYFASSDSFEYRYRTLAIYPMVPRISRESFEWTIDHFHYFTSVFDSIIDSDMEIARDLEKNTNITTRNGSTLSCRSIGDIGDL